MFVGSAVSWRSLQSDQTSRAPVAAKVPIDWAWGDRRPAQLAGVDAQHPRSRLSGLSVYGPFLSRPVWAQLCDSTNNSRIEDEAFPLHHPKGSG